MMLTRVRLVLLSWFCMWAQGQRVHYDSRANQVVLSQGVCRYGNSVECCWGWRRMDWGHCQPHCQQGCKHGECVGPDRCKCHLGYTGKACNQDLNECGVKPRPCKHRCMNTLGSYKCYCLDGYTLQSDGSCRNARTCYHANCQYGCEVIKGAVRCTCPSPGLRLGPDRRTCVDVDECVSGGGVCPRRRKCVNTFGSFVCKCHLGFKLTFIDGRYTCIDRDTRPFCSLNPASPKCRCKDGSCKAVLEVTLEPHRPRTTKTTTPISTTAGTTTTPLTTSTTTTTKTAQPASPTTTPATSTAAPPITSERTTEIPTTTTPPVTATTPVTRTTSSTPASTSTFLSSTTELDTWILDTTPSPPPPPLPTTSSPPPPPPPPSTTTTPSPPPLRPSTTTTPSPPPPPSTTTTPPSPPPLRPSTTTTPSPPPPSSTTTPPSPPPLRPSTTTTPSPPPPSSTTTPPSPPPLRPSTTTTPSPPPPTSTTTTPSPPPPRPSTTTILFAPPPPTSATSTSPPPPSTTSTPSPPPPPPPTSTTTTTKPTTTPVTVALMATLPSTTPPVTSTVNNRINKEVTHRQRGDVHIPRNPSHNQVWEFNIELGNTAEDARDDPEVDVLRCTFDQGLCDWLSDREGDLHWEVARNPAGGLYLSIPELKAGQRSVLGARLAVRIAPLWSRGDLCLSFFHWLTGHHVGVLQLFIRKTGREQRYSPTLWSRTGGHGWRQTQVTLTAQSVDMVLLKAERRRGRRGQMAVDNVTLKRGACL
uniref:nephronectin-like n=1 Tax=Semicossyphus pulcher TaxID=241346 RepID=UPI0037E780CE